MQTISWEDSLQKMSYAILWAVRRVFQDVTWNFYTQHVRETGNTW